MNRSLRPAAVLCLIALTPISLPAWNGTGHRAISFLAYSHLSPRAKQRVTTILKAHPDYADIFSRGTETDPVDIARNAFVTASTWPDMIRNDPRFFDKVPDGAKPLPGFPDMGRHKSWHYINTPWPSAFRSEPIDPLNALAEFRTLLSNLRKDGPVTPEDAYALPWIVHLIEDLHQPLHAVARFRKINGKTGQDLGGNLCYLAGDRNLHALWDSILGINTEDGPVARLAASLGDHQPRQKKPDLKPDTWIREGMELAGSVTYNFTESCDDREHPARLPASYRSDARRAAMQQAAMAAYRLAALLNEKFD
jgi:hypothetical protein